MFPLMQISLDMHHAEKENLILQDSCQHPMCDCRAIQIPGEHATQVLALQSIATYAESS